MAECPKCKYDRAKIRYDFGREKILRCGRCELMYIDPWPSEEETRAVYGDNYFKNSDFLKGSNEALFGYYDYIAERFSKQPKYARIAREVLSLLPQLDRQPKILEVGCGLGYFLDQAFEEGFDATGVEFNKYAVDRLRRKYAFPIISGGLENIDPEPACFDAVAMFDVIEHLRTPFDALDRVHDLLSPGGVLVLSTMDSDSFVSRLLGKRLEDFRRTREHLFFFSRKTISQILTEQGFEVISIRSIGHRFELGFLIDRFTLINRSIFGSLRFILTKISLSSLPISINPFTKMIVFARKVET